MSILPTVRINGKQYRGALRWDKVLRGLCSGFPKDNEPPVCNDPNVTPDECAEGNVGAVVRTVPTLHHLCLCADALLPRR